MCTLKTLLHFDPLLLFKHMLKPTAFDNNHERKADQRIETCLLRNTAETVQQDTH